MCFDYDDSIGTYLQTTEQYPLNSVFETFLDISDVHQGASAQFTMHRNSYRSVNSAQDQMFAISLIFDKDLSDE